MNETSTCSNCGRPQLPMTLDCPHCGAAYPTVIQMAESAARSPRGPSPASFTGTGLDKDVNPYAPPASSLASEDRYVSGTEEVWRTIDGKLVMRRSANLPERCVHCNGSADVWLRRKLSWHTPYLYLLVLISLLIYIIAALIVRKRADVYVPLCERHDSKRKIGLAIGWIGTLLGLGTLMTSLAVDWWPLALLGGLMLLVCMISGIAMAQVVVPTKIDDRHVWLRKISPDYLRELPSAPAEL